MVGDVRSHAARWRREVGEEEERRWMTSGVGWDNKIFWHFNLSFCFRPTISSSCVYFCMKFFFRVNKKFLHIFALGVMVIKCMDLELQKITIGRVFWII